MNVFLDTDVIIDYLLDRKPFADSSEKIFSLIERGHIKGYASSLCFSNLYYLLRKQMNRERAISLLKNITEFIKILKVDEASLIESLNSEFADFEDALQFYSAIAHKSIDVIVTRNVKDFKHSTISVMTPDLLIQRVIS